MADLLLGGVVEPFQLAVSLRMVGSRVDKPDAIFSSSSSKNVICRTQPGTAQALNFERGRIYYLQHFPMRYAASPVAPPVF